MLNENERFRRLLSNENIKPQNLGKTLGRFSAYFKPYWWVLVLILLMSIVATWSQVTTPDLIGQTVDCYLTPITATGTGMAPGSPVTENATSNCWLTEGNEPEGFTQTFITNVFT